MADRKVFFDKIGYTPTPKQWMLHGLYMWATILLAGGIRFSKSWWTAHELAYLIYDMFRKHLNQASPYGGERVWLVGLDYTQTKPEWEYLERIFKKLKMLHKKSTNFNGDSGKSSRMYVGMPNWAADQCLIIETKSADQLVKIAGFAPMYIAVCEAAQNPTETILQKCKERLSEKRQFGARLILSGTFEGSMGWYPQYFDRWEHGHEAENAIAISCPSWENPYAFPGGRSDPAILAEEQALPKELFDERYGGRPCPPQGAVLAGHFHLATHVNDEVAYFDEEDEVFLWYDPGFTHASAIEVVQVRKDSQGDPFVCIVDEVYTKDLLVPQIIDIVQTKPWWKNVNKYKCTIDYHGYDHTSAGIPVADQWYNTTGIRFRKNRVEINKTRYVEETGVDLLKTYLKVNPITGHPKLIFSSKCKGAIAESGGGLNPITGKTTVWLHKLNKEGATVGYKPIDDDCLKAIIYGLWDYFGYADKKKKVGIQGPTSYIGVENAYSRSYM